MDVELEPGKYIVAVSGGVDSVVLLDVLNNDPDVELVVAHFDHGIREDSARDRQFVQVLSEKYGLPFEYGEGQLGPNSSEAAARQARYEFLEKIRVDHDAKAIVTAHHQDDALETAIINMLRGTRRKGLDALKSNDRLKRPLLRMAKKETIGYAQSHDLEWREDSTNQDETYLRNYIRRQLLPRFSEPDKQKLLGIINQSRQTNDRLDALLDAELNLHSQGKNLDRRWFAQLPYDVALEVMATWLRRHDVRNFDSAMLERLVVSAKTGRPGQRFDVINGNIIKVEKASLALEAPER